MDTPQGHPRVLQGVRRREVLKAGSAGGQTVGYRNVPLSADYGRSTRQAPWRHHSVTTSWSAYNTMASLVPRPPRLPHCACSPMSDAV